MNTKRYKQTYDRALAKGNEPITKRRQVLFRIAELVPGASHLILDLSIILTLCMFCKYMVDNHDYEASAYKEDIGPKIDALINFVEMHGTLTDCKELIPHLNSLR